MTEALPISFFAASDLVIAPENPRDHAAGKHHEIAELASSIRMNGILIPLIGYTGDGKVFIVSGGRRTRALKLLVEQGTIDPGHPVPVRIMDKTAATEAGVAEQVSHKRLALADELNIMRQPRYQGVDDAILAGILGRPVNYVAKRRNVLQLPDFAVEALIEGTITLDQACDLLLYLGDDDSIGEIITQIERGYFHGTIRAAFERQCCEWNQHPMSQFVTAEAYEAAGGQFQMDLLSDDRFITTPEILNDLAKEQVISLYTARAENEGWAGLIVCGPDASIYSLSCHHGLSHLTDEEEAEFQALDNDEEHGEGFDWDRLRDLRSKRTGFYPPDLKKLLHVALSFSPRCRHGGQSRVGVLPEDLEPLYEGGWLERPEPEPEPDSAETGAGSEPDPSEGLPRALLEDIKLIKLHAWRNEAIKKPDTIFEALEADLRSRFRNSFDWTHTGGDRLSDKIMVSCTEKWEQAGNLIGVPDRKPADMRTALAFQIALRATRMLPIDVDAKAIRAVWTPDITFLSRYKKAQLVAMIDALSPGGSSLDGISKSEAVRILSERIAEAKDWLPLGF